MTPDKALEMVGKYARLTRLVKSLTLEIGASLDRCKGVNGKRGLYADVGTFQELMAEDTGLDAKGWDKNTHLWGWYQPERDDDGSLEWEGVTLEKNGAECCHCYNAHLAIQQRKQARKDLGVVKGVMSRTVVSEG